MVNSVDYPEKYGRPIDLDHVLFTETGHPDTQGRHWLVLVSGRFAINVLMFTNTFVPHVGGVARSILALRGELRRLGHRVLIVAPAYENDKSDSEDVLRIPAFPHFAGSDYSLPIPLSRRIRTEIEAFAPDIIHSHHPFLLGGTALRTAASLGIPAVYTYHTRYDFYVDHTEAGNSALARLARSLANGYADLADAVIAPSESLRALIQDRGVCTPVEVIPTGIDLKRFGGGNRGMMRQRLGIPDSAFVVGHLGRLAPEKNLGFLAEAVALFLGRHPKAWFIVSGHGPLREVLEHRFASETLRDRAVLLDVLADADMPSFYAAMDAFAFTSLTETQGLVLGEAMAAGRPVVALDAPGAREAVGAGEAGRLLEAGATADDYAKALSALAALPRAEADQLSRAARQRAELFSLEKMGCAVEALYLRLIRTGRTATSAEGSDWEGAWHAILKEAALLENLFHALGMAVRPDQKGPAP